MKCPHLLAIVLILAVGGSCQSKDASKPSPKKAKEKSMNMEEIPYLPFGLAKEADLEQVEIKLSFISAKTGAGKQEISLAGNGRVRLYFSRSFQDKSPKVLEGNCGPERVLRLLDFMEGNGLFGLPDEVSGLDRSGSQRMLEVRLPGRVKKIAVQESDLDAVEQMIGALKLVAGQCLPEALNNRFFPNL